ARADHIPGRLSGGEAQRVAVARALIGDPLLLLADEPTGNLDEGSAAVVFELLRRLCRARGTATLMVTHSQRLAAAADRTLRLEHGMLVAQ
ncbi:MAG: ATP-binding cassette domain-containing protein, partial [Zetaproteobacteria bacterium]